MKRMVSALPLLLALGLIVLTACRAPKELVYKDFNNFGVDKLGFGTSTVSMNLLYYNPNNFGLQLKRTELDIYIDGTFLGHTSQDHKITIPRLADFSLPLKVDVDMQHIFKNAFNTLFSREVTVKVTGRIKLGKANIFFGMPVNYEGKHKLGLIK